MMISLYAFPEEVQLLFYILGLQFHYFLATLLLLRIYLKYHPLLLPCTEILDYLSQVECQRAMSIEKLAALADEYHLPHKEYNSIWEAYTEAIKAASHNDMVFVGGSSYVVAEFLTKLAQ